MAGKSGGSWKVAYADFVTAMMAFFLVMWITAQDQKVKQSVARYFNNPMNFASLGTSRKPNHPGALFDSAGSGTVPQANGVAAANGRQSHTPQGENGVVTRLVSNWIFTHGRTRTHWQDRAAAIRRQASVAPEVEQQLCTAEELAIAILAVELSEQFGESDLSRLNSLQQELLEDSLSQCNWSEVAEDLLAQ